MVDDINLRIFGLICSVVLVLGFLFCPLDGWFLKFIATVPFYFLVSLLLLMIINEWSWKVFFFWLPGFLVKRIGDWVVRR